MRVLIDESRLFSFPSTKNQECKISTMAGVVLPFMPKKERASLLKQCANFKKAFRLSDSEIIGILDVMISKKVKVITVFGDHCGIDQAEIGKYKEFILQKLQCFADQNSLPIEGIKQAELNEAFQSLLWKLRNLNIQEFAKLSAICECVAGCTEYIFCNADKFRATDFRKRLLFVDDQDSKVKELLKPYLMFYMWVESMQGRFNNISPKAFKELCQLLIMDVPNKCIDITKFYNKIVVGNSDRPEWANLDDTYPELKIADVFATVLQKIVNNVIISGEIVAKVRVMLKINTMLHFRENLYDCGNLSPLAKSLFAEW